MRARLIPTRAQACAWGLVVLVGAALTGCATQTGMGPQVSTSKAQLQRKIGLIEQDACYTENPRDVYQLCGSRYMTEISNAALTALNETEGTNAAGPANNEINTIRNKINDFNGHSCANGIRTQTATCAADLQAVNAALNSLGKTLPTATPIT